MLVASRVLRRASQAAFSCPARKDCRPRWADPGFRGPRFSKGHFSSPGGAVHSAWHACSTRVSRELLSSVG
eukprot:1593770-Pyramimonas_sp.AAC.1